MAVYKNDPLGGQVDYSQYKSWPPVIDPSTGGIIGYKIPGFPQYLFDEVASNASGRKVLRQNPQAAIEEQQKAQAAQQKALEQQEFNQSPVGQLLPVGASIAGLYAANQFGPQTAAEIAAEEVLKQQALSQGAAGASAQGLAGAAAEGSLMGPAAPTIANGGLVGPAAPAAPGMFSLGGIGSAGNYILPAVGALGAYNLATEDVSAGRGILQGAASGAAIGSGFGGVGAIPGAIIGGGLGLAKSLFGQHKSTRQEAADKTSDLLEQSDNPNYQAYVSGMRKQYESAPTGKAYAGKYDTWNEYEKAGLEAADLTGVYGNIKTYGEEWANLTEPQRQAITQANIESGLYKSKKGDVEITDKNKAIENKNNVLKGFQVGATTPAAPVNPLAQAAAQGAIAIPRPVVPKQSGFVRR